MLALYKISQLRKFHLFYKSNNIVYLHNIKVVSRITARQDLNNYSKVMFKIYLISDENTLKKKIRLQML